MKLIQGRIRIPLKDADPKPLWNLDIKSVVTGVKQAANEIARLVSIENAC